MTPNTWVPGERLAGRSSRADWDVDGDGPRIGVLALQGDFADHQASLAARGLRTRQVRTPGQLRGVDALVLPGGESTTMLKLLAARATQIQAAWRGLASRREGGGKVARGASWR